MSAPETKSKSKPLGPIPAGFGVADGVMTIAGTKVTDIIAQQGGQTPLFVYDRALIARRVADLRAAMPPRLALHYAMKANPFGPLLREMAGLVDGFDIASGGELGMALNAGLDPARISFAGPGKRDVELQAAISAGVTLNIESVTEAERALTIAERIGINPRMAIRVNPDFGLAGSGMKMGGGAKPFGVDADRVPALARAIVDTGAQWRGFHIFAGSQALSADAVIETQAQTLELAARLAREAGVGVPHLNLGGGMGIPYFPGDTPIDAGAVGAALADRFAALPDELADTHFAMEMGRYLVGEAGVYLTRIVDVKTSHGETYLVTDGGLHHQLAASGNFGTVVRRNYPVAIATRFDAPATDEANVVGCLCTPLDRLADKALFPPAQVGDIVAVFCAGAYGASASPATFLGQGPAGEVLV
ncbi:pyridoxal-dependent decarboxylase, exosortase A system-associated [Novosphingobium sp. FSY-8]|uniref:Pyridoxal-dependent decarboxylase, exosortase A system-associated n=1 Tax=Novosphingobium ovatum TaxID=1908523 RepID=A0ABW9XC01_9SPHN|nr:pyridoxal-dependent decarboxylase, exosortase A system-associated [Novosphingobium ovatum]NBC36068.1 pyridoxal-dependent decarboxylase, exosortase A system-associated [Novosphingobium ovatum]